MKAVDKGQPNVLIWPFDFGDSPFTNGVSNRVSNVTEFNELVMMMKMLLDA